MTTKQYAYVCAGCGAIYWDNNIACDCEVPSLMQFDRVAVTPAPEMVWKSGEPRKKGVYRVKCDGPSPNAGYRYWNGERWGCLCSTYSYANQKRDSSRKSRINRPVLWLDKKGGAA